MIFHYDQFEFMFLLHRDMSREKFLNAVGASKGYAKEMFGRMYDALVRENLDVIKEYEIYYSVEYDSLGKYLYRKWNMSYETVDAIVELIGKSPDLRLFRRVERSYHGSDLRRFMSEDPMVERIQKILIMK